MTTSICENEARVDVVARDFRTHGQKAFFDVKVFNPFAKSNQKFALASCFAHHERQKKEPMSRESLRLKMAHSHPLSSVPQVEWEDLHPSSTVD